MAVKDVQHLLLHVARRQHVGPGFFLTLASEELQVVPDFAQHRLGLTFDFLKQEFLSAHS